MIDVFYWPTPNGWKVTIMLEECELDYRIVPVDIGGGDQFKPEFLRLSPNNRMPAIIDHDPSDCGAPISIFESGAILEYLGDKAGRFLPSDPRNRARVMQWVHWQMSNFGPMMGNANHFKNYAKNLADDPAHLEYGIKRFMGEVDRLAGVMDAQLSVNEHLAGQDYTIADMITWPWASLLGNVCEDSIWDEFPNLARWHDQLRARPLLSKGYMAGRELAERERTPEEDARRRAILFNQTNEQVRRAREEALRTRAN